MGRRGMMWAGVALLTVGLVLIGYVVWQLYGTNYVSRQQQAEAVEEVQRIWSEQSEQRTAPETEVRSAGPSGAATALIRIPRFGSDYVMPVFAGTSDEVLAKGFGHFDHAAGPGQRGNYALAAHRVTHGEPLRDMPSLRPGDLVEVETRTHVYVYRLTSDPEDLVVTFEDTWVVDRRPDNPREGGVEPPDHPRLITLTTCAEIFHTDDRMIVFGHLVQARDKTDPQA